MNKHNNKQDTRRQQSSNPGADSTSNAWRNWVEEHSDSNIQSLPERKFYKPTKEQLEKILPCLILCFCNKPAHRTYTLEYGPVLECGNYQVEPNDNNIKTKYICGFHVHELAWNKLRNHLMQEGHLNADYQELRACPLFNFTFCTIFYITNDYPMKPPSVPLCFCNRPVIIRDNKAVSSLNKLKVIEFTCQNCDIEGARPKCSWILRANEVAFPRPKQRLHRDVNSDDYTNAKQDKLALIRSYQKSVVSESHKHDLLSALSTPLSHTQQQDFATQFGTLKLESDIPLEPSSSNSTSGSCSSKYRSLLVPTSVIAKKSSAVSKSNVSSIGSTTPMNLMIDEEQENVVHCLKRQIEILQASKDSYQRESEEIRSVFQKAKIEAEVYQKLAYRYKSEREEETILRLNTQERLSSIEVDVVEMIAEKEELLAKLSALPEQDAQEDGLEKCKVCFSRTVEYALIPCFHFGIFHFYHSYYSLLI
jgi:hypothetical protein